MAGGNKALHNSPGGTLRISPYADMALGIGVRLALMHC